MVLPILTVPYLVQHIGLEGFGAYSFIVLIAYYASLLPDFGFTQAAPIFMQSTDASGKKEYFHLVLNSKLYLFLLTSLLTSAFFFWGNAYFSLPVLLGVTAWVLGSTLNTTWFLQGDRQIQFLSLFNLGSKIVFTILVFSFINVPGDLTLLVCILGLTNLVNGLLGLVPVRNQLKGFKISPPDTFLWATIKGHFPYFKYLINNNLLANSGGIILNHFHGARSLGFFSSYEKLNKGVLGFFGPISSALYPFFAKQHAENVATFQKRLFFIAIGTLLTFGVLLLIINLNLEAISRFLFDFFLPDSHLVFAMFSVWSLLGILNNFLGTQYLTIIGRISVYNRIYFVGSVLFVLVCFWSVPAFSAKGLLFSMTLAEGLISVAQGIAVIKFKS